MDFSEWLVNECEWTGQLFAASTIEDVLCQPVEGPLIPSGLGFPET